MSCEQDQCDTDREARNYPLATRNQQPTKENLMSLSANRDLPRFVDQELRALKVKAAAHIYKGGFVGIDRASGYARPLTGGDLFAGVAYEEADNSSGSNGDIACRVYTQGDFQ